MADTTFDMLFRVNDRDLKEVQGRIRDLNKAMGGIGSATERGSAPARRSLLSVRNVAMGLGGVLAGGSVLGWAKNTVQALGQVERLGAQTDAVIKSTGGAANVSAKDVARLSEEIESYAGVIDAEAVTAGQNMLLTFTNIKNGVGKSNQVFDDATRTLADMSTALGSDMSKSAIQLGKALNDPVKGVSALSKVGVTFTKEQKEQIKALVESGDTMKAQKIILAELSKEFGGSARAAGKTFPGQVAILKDTLDDLGRRVIGGTLLPALEATVAWANENGPQIEAVLGTAWKTVSTVMGEAVEVGASVIAFFRENEDLTVSLADGLAVLVVGLGTYVAVMKVIAIATKAWAVAQGILNAVLTANPIGLVIGAIAGLVAGLVLAYRRSETFRRIVNQTWRSIRDTARPVIEWLRVRVPEVIAAILAFVRKHWPPIAEVLGKAISKAWDLIRPILNKIKENFGIVTGALEKWKDLHVWLGVNGWAYISKLWDKAKGPLSSLKDAFSELASWAGKVVDFFGSLAGKAEDAYGWLKKLADIASKIPGIGGGDMSVDAWGPALDPTAVPGAGGGISARADTNPGLWDEMGLGQAMGLTVGSTYRPGATIRGSGRPSLHGIYPSKAVDMFGDAGAMMRYFFAVIGRPGIRELIHSPYIWSPTRGLHAAAGAALEDHYDHVHVGIYHKGGRIPGPVGAEREATVLAGETVLPIGAGLGGDVYHINVNVPSGSVVLTEGQLVDAVIDGINRKARKAGRVFDRGVV